MNQLQIGSIKLAQLVDGVTEQGRIVIVGAKKFRKRDPEMVADFEQLRNGGKRFF